ncbi:Pycsar system effector family protein [Methyloglobulus morosus]
MLNLTPAGAFTFLFGVSTVLLLIYVIYLSIFKILRPRLAKFYSDGDSLFYFGHLAHMDRNKMLENFKNLDDQEILRNLSEQIFEVSRILNTKTEDLHNSMNYLYLSILSLLAFVLSSRLL